MGRNQTQVSVKQDSHGHKMKSRSELLSQARGAPVGSAAREADIWLQPELQVKSSNSFTVFL